MVKNINWLSLLRMHIHKKTFATDEIGSRRMLDDVDFSLGRFRNGGRRLYIPVSLEISACISFLKD
jgi:hypothetical protein